MTNWGPSIPVDGVRPGWLGDDSGVQGLLNWPPDRRGQWEEDFEWADVTAIRLPEDHWVYAPLSRGMTPWAGGDSAPEDWDGGPVLLRCGERIPAFDWLTWRHSPAMSGNRHIIGYHATRKAEPAPVEGDGNPYEPLKRAIHKDAEYAWSWQCNVAMPIMDEIGCTHEQANRAAARVMSMLFDVNIIALPMFQHFERTWAENPTPNTVTLPRMSEAEAGKLVNDANENCIGPDAWDRCMDLLRHLNLIADPTPLDRFAAAHPEIDWTNTAIRDAVSKALEEK